jgi:hypothetical protein
MDVCRSVGGEPVEGSAPGCAGRQAVIIVRVISVRILIWVSFDDLRPPNALVQLQARYHYCGVAASEKCLSAATYVRWRWGASEVDLRSVLRDLFARVHPPRREARLLHDQAVSPTWRMQCAALDARPDEGRPARAREAVGRRLGARSELPLPENGSGASLASPYYHCAPIDIITHPGACGKVPVRVQTSRSF